MTSLNTNGLRDVDKSRGLLQWLHSLPSPADVICLQETHCLSEAECRSWFSSSGFSCLVSPGSAHSCGCIVHFRPSLNLACVSGLMMLGGMCNVNLLSRTPVFVCLTSMHRTATLLGIFSLSS